MTEPEKNNQATLKETLENEREFTDEEIKARNAKTIRIFTILMAFVLSLILILVVLGVVYGG